ncbi:MAG: ATP-dependent RNA helicase HrpA [Ilumatobacteraceae bacterium]
MSRPPRSDSRAAREARLASIVAARPIDVPSSLPIAERRDELVAAIREHQVVVVAGETGSGKSTQLPKLCLEAGRGVDGMIGHTQPRRVAARTVAERAADELGTAVGDGVGYSVRFNDRVSDSTLVQVMTDGILLNELQRDRELRRYDTIIIDEAHERSLNIDFLLGYLKQLLPRRPDLHVVITSATIDTDRFAAHFADAHGDPAPVFVVEGRTYPVEVRYRPYGGDDPDEPGDRRDQVRAVIDAVDELEREGPGDVLVFLSGEREIHDIADALRDERRPGLEVLPLYARLSAHEQHRIFEPHRGRRVVLATNVAETSITVPGVRYVVDTGVARISRYSRRLKVQRLPIEPVSQASANQRAGRCGRVAPGVCIRLYTEDDFAQRPEFTEPEILRTNLASVILQMTAIGLGDVARFPFVEPPDSAAIRDGDLLLDELGAVRRDGDRRRLTAVGRQLARLPIDPRLGRMVIEAARYGCVREVLVIASALSIQDVRERPREHPERANELHARFRVDGSDLLGIVELWDYLRDRQRELSGNAFRRMCHDEFLHYLRARVARSVQPTPPGRRSARHPTDGRRGAPRPRAPGRARGFPHPDRDARRRQSRVRGIRDSRFVIAPGSVLSKRPPRWVVATELVETDRIRARRLAAIQPEWAESLAGDLVKRSYGEPWWDERQGRALIAETVTLYGLPIVSNRTIGLDRVDRRLARELFIRRALVAGEWTSRHDFVAENERFRRRVELLEARVRRTDLLDDEALVAFFDERLPDDATSAQRFDRWWRDTRRTDPTRLDLDGSVLTNRSGIRLSDYPDQWTTGGASYPITYRFEPGSPLDGASVTVPLTELNQLDDSGFGWLVPGYRDELVELLVRSLPKDIRRDLIPMTETAAAAAARLDTSAPTITEALAAALREVAGVSVGPDDFSAERLPTHLRMHVIVVGADGEVVDAGDDLDAIRARQAGGVRSAIADAVPVEERRDILRWQDIGHLDRVVETRSPTGNVVRAFPTLLDRGDRVTLRVVDNESLQRRAMRGGVRRLLLMAAAPTVAKVERTLGQSAKLAVAAGPVLLADLTAECIDAAVDAVLARYDLPWDEPSFSTIERAVRDDAPQLAADALAEAADIIAAAERVRARLSALTADALAPTVADARAHLGRLVAPGFVGRSGLDRLPDVHRYVRGIEYRLDHLSGDVPRDQRRMAVVRPIERELAEAIDRAGRVDDDLREISWLVEELRVSTFAQPVGVHGPVSPKRIRTALHQKGSGTFRRST